MSRSEPAQTFVGRAADLAVLRAELDRLSRPNASARIVLVSADPGVGKTRLLREVVARHRTARVLTGRGSPLGATIPLAIITEPLAAYLDTVDGRHRLPELAHRDPAGRLELFARLRRLLTALASDRPLVLMLDDLHLADPASWDLIAYLGRVPPVAPVLVLAASRIAPLFDDAEFTRSIGALIRDGLATEVRLSPLTEREIGELVTATVDNPDAELVSWLYRRGRGNPLLTVAMLSEVTDDPASRAGIPASVAEWVRQVRTVLPAGARRALDLAAVLGHPFPVATAAPLLGPEGADALERLIAERLLVEGSDGYDFAHPLIQEAVYSGLGPARRRDLHEQVAAALVAAPLAVRAYHIARSALPGDLTAVALLREAAAEAAEAAAHREALRHLTAALALIPVAGSTALRVRVLDEIAGHASLIPDHEAGITALRDLAALQAGEPVALARTRMRLASFLSTGAADVAAAEQAATEAVELLRGAHPQSAKSTVDLAAAMNERAWIRGMAGDFTGQADGCREALALVGDGGDAGAGPRDGAATVRLHVIGPLGGVLGLLGDFAAARDCHTRARALAEATGDPGQIGWHAAVASLTELYAGRFADAAAMVDPPVDAAPLLADIATPWRTLTDWFFGRWRVGQRDCEAVRQLFPLAPSAHMAWSFAMAALFETATGSTAPASGMATPGVRAWFGPALRAYGDRDLYFFTALCRWAIGTCHWLLGEPETALEYLRRSASWLRRTRAIGFEGLLLAELPEVLVALGLLDEAQAHVDRAQEVAAVLGTPFAAAQAAYARALIASARGQRSIAKDAFTEAIDGYQACAAPFAQARALEHRAEVARGDHALADLDAAARQYGALPAPVHRDRVLARMRGTGLAGRRAAQQVGALTPREREIALLAARGLSTVDIAGRLHLSDRTVESHLGRIYRKLGIDGRAGLGRALERNPGW